MGQTQAKDIATKPDVRFMQQCHADSCKFLKKWIKKHGFNPCLKNSEEMTELVRRLREERKEKLRKGKKTNVKDEELKMAKLWLEQSTKRVLAIRVKDEKKKAKQSATMAALGISPDHETTPKQPSEHSTEAIDRHESQSKSDEKQEDPQSTLEGRTQKNRLKRNANPRLPDDSSPSLTRHARRQQERLYPELPQEGVQNSPQQMNNPFATSSPPAYTGSPQFQPLPKAYGPLSWPDSPAQTTGAVTQYPMFAVANPAYTGQPDGQPPTILVHRPWTQQECTEACKGLGDVENNPTEWTINFRSLALSYHLNGREMESALRMALGHRWSRVRGSFNPNGTDGAPLPHDSNDLAGRTAAVLHRVEQTFRKVPDYSKIHQCRQQLSESVEEYRARLEEVFRNNSGLQDDQNPNGAYQSQLKSHLMDGMQESIRRFIQKYLITWRTATVQEIIQWATHATEVQQKRKASDATAKLMTILEGVDALTTVDPPAPTGIYYQNARRSRGRGRPNQDHRRYSRRTATQDDICYNCNKAGHFARDCPLPKTGYRGPSRRDPPFNPSHSQ